MNKILIIEDEEIVRSNIVEILESGEFEVIGAENGRRGVELAVKNLPNLIICDVTMPELDGYGVLKLLRQNSTTKTIPFIFLTARADKTDIRTGMNLGADDYLTKPFRRAELLTAVTARLAKHQAMTERYHDQLEVAQKELIHSLYYDRLTNLPNQLLLRERFDESLAQKGLSQAPSIVIVAIDRFYRVVESLGYAWGDRLIQNVAHRLISCVDFGDTVARLNTDQFAIILASENQQSLELTEQASQVAQRIIERLSKPINLDQHKISLSASIGIALSPKDGEDIDELMQHAEAALSYAKQMGGNQFQFYSSNIQAVSVELLNLETNLRYALESSQFQIYYQPQVDLISGRIIGAEALIRWMHPEQGFISPGQFIPLAEQNGLIVPIGEWVLQTACQQLKKWQDAGLPPLRIAVNLSARQFNQPDLIDKIVNILASTKLEPQYLEVELTESMLVDNIKLANAQLKKLKALGLSISLDDFGTGYSSLSYLQKFNLDILKIDRCFVTEINHNEKNATITKAIISMAHGLNLHVIAEGVETEAELEFLRQQKCNTIQGYLFSPPVPGDKFEEMLKNGAQLKLPSLI
jgi:diguanylate cyclase (GGDEF)-like protein